MAVWSIPKLGTELLENVEPVLDSLGTVWGGLCDNSCNKLWFGCCWAGNNHGFRFHKVEPVLGEWAAHGQPTARLRTVKNSPGLLGWTENGPCVW